MTQQEPYYNPDLALEDLARIVDMPKRELSELINTHLGKTFLEYINDHRIEAAKQRFDQSEDNKETVLEVMYASGFNSKEPLKNLPFGPTLRYSKFKDPHPA